MTERQQPTTRDGHVGGRRVVNIAVGLGLVLIVSIVVLFQRWGRPRFVRASQLAEGKTQVAQLARGLVGCMAARRAPELPPSARPVPAEPSDLRGAGYRSSPADWEQPVFTCADFRPSGVQRYRMEWERRDADRGMVRASVDLQGDGVVDAVVEASVECRGTGAERACGMGTVEELLTKP